MRKRYRFGLKTASKVEERRILQVAEDLLEDPSPLFPECDAACDRIFRKERRAVARITSKADDGKALERLSRKGPPLARAFAATLLLRHQGKATHLGVLKVGKRPVAYAKRGTAAPEKLVAVQCHGDPWVRIVGYLDIVRRYGAHFYSSPGGFSCSMTASAPGWYVSDVIRMSALKGRNSCPHATGHGPFIRIEWRSAGRTLNICRRCDPGGNLFHQLARGMGSREPETDLVVSATFSPEGGCLDVPPLPGDDIAAYTAGELTNGQLMDRFHALLQRAAREQRAIVIDGRCLTAAEATRHLATAEHERIALGTVFGAKGHLGSGVTAAQVVQDNWAALGRAMLERVAPGEDLEVYLADTRPSLLVLASAAEAERRRRRAEALPVLEGLPAIGAVAHGIAVAYRVRGEEAALQSMDALLKERDLPMKTRALLLAVHRALGLRAETWRFGADAGEYADYVQPMTEDLLKGPEDGYRAAMSALLAAMGEEMQDL